MRLQRGTLVVVDWLDAVADHGWDDASRAKAERVRSVGVLCAVGRDGTLSLAADFDPSEKHKGDTNRRIVIPGGMVKRVRRVRLAQCEVLR